MDFLKILRSFFASENKKICLFAYFQKQRENVRFLRNLFKYFSFNCLYRKQLNKKYPDNIKSLIKVENFVFENIIFTTIYQFFNSNEGT